MLIFLLVANCGEGGVGGEKGELTLNNICIHLFIYFIYLFI